MDQEDLIRYFAERKPRVIDSVKFREDSHSDIIVSRKEQMKEIAECLYPVTMKHPARNIVINGKPGNGKTFIFKRMVAALRKNVEQEEKDILIETVHVPCDTTKTIYSTVTWTLSKVNGTLVAGGYKAEKFVADLVDSINAKGKEHSYYALILELEGLETCKLNNEILDTFLKISSLVNNASVSIMIPDCTGTLPKSFNKQILGDAKFKVIGFPNYTKEELFEILEQRKGAFEEGSLPDEVIWRCTEIAVNKYNGDARWAIRFLRDAGDSVESGNVITVEDVNNSAKSYDPYASLAEAVGKQPLHDRIMFEAIYFSNEVLAKNEVKYNATTGVVVSVYQKICELLEESVLSVSNSSRRISDLDYIGFIDAKKRPRSRGNTRYVTLKDPVIEQHDQFLSPEQFKIVEEKRKDLETIVLKAIR